VEATVEGARVEAALHPEFPHRAATREGTVYNVRDAACWVAVDGHESGGQWRVSTGAGATRARYMMVAEAWRGVAPAGWKYARDGDKPLADTSLGACKLVPKLVTKRAAVDRARSTDEAAAAAMTSHAPAFTPATRMLVTAAGVRVEVAVHEAFSDIGATRDGHVFNLRTRNELVVPHGKSSHAPVPEGSGRVQVFVPNGPQRFRSQIVYECWKGAVPHGCEMDHVDNNLANDALDNLQPLTPRQHGAKNHTDDPGKAQRVAALLRVPLVASKDGEPSRSFNGFSDAAEQLFPEDLVGLDAEARMKRIKTTASTIGNRSREGKPHRGWLIEAEDKPEWRDREGEQWREPPAHPRIRAGAIQVSNLGRVRFKHGGGKRTVEGTMNNTGQPSIHLAADGALGATNVWPTNQLTALVWLGAPPAGRTNVIHIDHNRLNNAASNLRYASALEVNQHSAEGRRMMHEAH
jgi:hypothetical protein